MTTRPRGSLQTPKSPALPPQLTDLLAKPLPASGSRWCARPLSSPAPLPRLFPPPRIPFPAWFTAPPVPVHTHTLKGSSSTRRPQPSGCADHLAYHPSAQGHPGAQLSSVPHLPGPQPGRGSPPPPGKHGDQGALPGAPPWVSTRYCIALWTVMSPPPPLATPTLPTWLESRTNPTVTADPHLRPGPRCQSATSPALTLTATFREQAHQHFPAPHFPTCPIGA